MVKIFESLGHEASGLARKNTNDVDRCPLNRVFPSPGS